MVLGRKTGTLDKGGFSIAHMNRDERGSVAMEYAIIAGLLSIAIIISVTAIGTTLESQYQDIGTTMQEALGD
ncbi:Flp family type IVb pilin [Pseudovibrio flavus]|uniref:Flp family type IVb pilin n=1 Tax=Pseudovibrio flavus TaxID=2529854 RepID=UPI00211CA0A2|nr:Flp family type IVb pilin [Pseudovibrio flavus]